MHALTEDNDSPLQVSAAVDGDRAAWDAFVGAHPEGSFYHLYDWKLINERDLGHPCEFILARDARGDVAGVLPLVFVRSRLLGRILCSMPFMNYGGPLARSPRVTRELIDAATALAAKLGADYLELRCAEPLQTTMPVSLRKVSMSVPLCADPEELWNSFSPKHRKNVRRAQKNELDVQSGGAELLPEFFAVLERSWRDLGTPLYSRRYFERIASVFAASTRVYVCRHKGQAIGATFIGFHNGTVEGMWAGGRPEFRNLQPNYVLYWEMLKDACLAGHRRFHLGRSTAESGAEQFKSKWNADTRQLYWYFHRPRGGEMPNLNVDNPRFKLAIAAWRRLPLWATRVAGPPLARLIP